MRDEIPGGKEVKNNSGKKKIRSIGEKNPSTRGGGNSSKNPRKKTAIAIDPLEKTQQKVGSKAPRPK